MRNKEIFAFPIICKFTEYKAIMVKIPASNAGIFNLVCIHPVTAPAIIPPIPATITVIQGFTPMVINTAEIAAPIGKLPSTVKSATSKILKVMNTPNANNAHNRPCAMVLIIKFVIDPPTRGCPHYYTTVVAMTLESGYASDPLRLD